MHLWYITYLIAIKQKLVDGACIAQNVVRHGSKAAVTFVDAVNMWTARFPQRHAAHRMLRVTNDAGVHRNASLSADVQRCTSYWLLNYDVRVPNKILCTIHNACCADAVILCALDASKHDVNTFFWNVNKPTPIYFRKKVPRDVMQWTISSSDDSISGFQFRYDIDTIIYKKNVTKYCDIDIDILKIISMLILYKHRNNTWRLNFI